MGKYNKEEAEKSAQILEDIIPHLEKYFSGEIISTESENKEIKNDYTKKLTKLLDNHAATDAILLKDDLLFGIAHRVDKKNKRSITVRYKNSETTKPTEYQKLNADGNLKPKYHVTTTLVDGKPKYIAIIQTNRLLDAINDGIGELKDGCETDGPKSKYFELSWHDLKPYGIEVKVLNYEEV